jgi:hypothetical protein
MLKKAKLNAEKEAKEAKEAEKEDDEWSVPELAWTGYVRWSFFNPPELNT